MKTALRAISVKIAGNYKFVSGSDNGDDFYAIGRPAQAKLIPSGGGNLTLAVAGSASRKCEILVRGTTGFTLKCGNLKFVERRYHKRRSFVARRAGYNNTDMALYGTQKVDAGQNAWYFKYASGMSAETKPEEYLAGKWSSDYITDISAGLPLAVKTDGDLQYEFTADGKWSFGSKKNGELRSGTWSYIGPANPTHAGLKRYQAARPASTIEQILYYANVASTAQQMEPEFWKIRLTNSKTNKAEDYFVMWEASNEVVLFPKTLLSSKNSSFMSFARKK